MKKEVSFAIILLFVFLFSSCTSEIPQNPAPTEPLITDEIAATDGVPSYMSVEEFSRSFLDDLNTRYESMMYRVDVSKQLLSYNLRIAISVDVNNNLETTGVYIYTNVDSNDSIVRQIKFVVFQGANAIYFNNGLTSLLHTCGLGLSDDSIKEIVSEYTKTFANGEDSYSGITNDGYSIFMEKTKVEYLTAHVVTIKF